MKCRHLTDQGGREYMEDRWSHETHGSWDIVTVADGHGGREVAELLVDKMPKLLGHQEDFSFPKLFSLYNSMDDEISRECSAMVGSTLLTLCVNSRDDVIVAANCGDTMAIVGNKKTSRWLSQEHKASSEVAAIEARGGRVIAPDGMPRVNGILNLSRAMGDFHLKKYITCSPFVTRCRLRDFDYAFAATDGVWDVMSKEDVHEVIIKSHDDPLEEILKVSRSKGSTDNIAMILLDGFALQTTHPGMRPGDRIL